MKKHDKRKVNFIFKTTESMVSSALSQEVGTHAGQEGTGLWVLDDVKGESQDEISGRRNENMGDLNSNQVKGKNGEESIGSHTEESGKPRYVIDSNGQVHDMNGKPKEKNLMRPKLSDVKGKNRGESIGFEEFMEDVQEIFFLTNEGKRRLRADFEQDLAPFVNPQFRPLWLKALVYGTLSWLKFPKNSGKEICFISDFIAQTPWPELQRMFLSHNYNIPKASVFKERRIESHLKDVTGSKSLHHVEENIPQVKLGNSKDPRPEKLEKVAKTGMGQAPNEGRGSDTVSSVKKNDPHDQLENSRDSIPEAIRKEAHPDIGHTPNKGRVSFFRALIQQQVVSVTQYMLLQYPKHTKLNQFKKRKAELHKQ
ncbi:hypothetical protein PGTUg99_025842 [Puccinia graminis f. sp. tritici]|uniref:Uncharacterized protein n=1 Tax=Puccinia graminis f. sp. tritici TaxID=56615 RepID=A0A5B0S711_PUCGR|nr:hypothetical protein PGTUg99_025842 [Puccinia graminis f. sp. tritici]